MAKKTTQSNLFNGRRIVRVDASACNVWRFYFDDKGVVEVEVESIGPSGLYGMFARPLVDGNTNHG
jgi:hypothetical protein